MSGGRSIAVFLITCAFFVSAAAQDPRAPGLRVPIIPRQIDDRYIVPEKAFRKVKITDEERSRYRERTGNGVRLLKLFAAPDCVEKFTINAGDERCIGNFDFIQVSYYSFQTRDYGLGFAELGVRESDLTAGVRADIQGILMNIGDVALRDLTENSEDLRPFLDLPIARTEKEAGEQKDRFLEGIEIGGRTARSRVELKTGETFLIRTIRYGSTGRPGFDLTVAFRIEEMTPEKTVLVLWKEIREKNAPSLKKDREKND